MFFKCSVQFSHSVVFNTLRPYELQHTKPLSITNSQSLLKLMSIESVMPSNHLILCRPLLLLPSISPSIRVFSSESILHIRWPKYCSFSFSISPSNEYSRLISFGMGFPGGSAGKESAHNAGDLSWEDRLEKGTATHSSFLAWRIPWTVQSMGSQRVRHDWATFTFTSFRNDWFDLLAVQWTSKSLLQHCSSKASIQWCSASFMVQLSHPYMTTGKTIALTRRTSVGKVMSLLFNMLSRLVVAFLPRSKCLLISWPQSPSAVIFGAQENKDYHCFYCFPIYLPWNDGTRYHAFCFLNVEF